MRRTSSGHPSIESPSTYSNLLSWPYISAVMCVAEQSSGCGFVRDQADVGTDLNPTAVFQPVPRRSFPHHSAWERSRFVVWSLVTWSVGGFDSRLRGFGGCKGECPRDDRNDHRVSSSGIHPVSASQLHERTSRFAGRDFRHHHVPVSVVRWQSRARICIRHRH